MTYQQLVENLSYDPLTGVFMWVVPKHGRDLSKPAGAYDDRGYLQIGFEGKLYFGHRLAVLFMTGEWPKYEVDHINGVKNDNRYCNLRDVITAVNGHNRVSANRNNKGSGLLGAYARGGKFMSMITVGRKQKYLGTFDTAAEAHAAYMAEKVAAVKTLTGAGE